MDRTRADDASSDVAVADLPAMPHARSGSDTLYRRPPARLPASGEAPAEGTTGSRWFDGEPETTPSDQTDAPPTGRPDYPYTGRPEDDYPNAGRPEADYPYTGRPEAVSDAESPQPRFGPAPPATAGRASFGFSAGPISPVRALGDPTSPAYGPVTDPPPARPAASWPPPARLDQAPVQPEAPAVDPPVRDLREPPVRDLREPSPPDSPLHEFAARHVGPAAPDRTPSAPPAAAPVDRQPRQSRFVTIGMLVLSVVVLLAGTVVGIIYFSGSDQGLDAVLHPAGDTGKRTVSAPLDNRTKASFEMLAATNKVHVSVGELGDDLYRISTPDDAGIKPSPLIRNDDVELQVTRDGDGTGGEIEVVLSAKVQWSLRFAGYSEEQSIDFTDGQVTDISMVAGTSRAELSLPEPSGTVPVSITGAVDNLTVKSPAGNPVRIKVSGGATTVLAGTRTLRDVPAGSTLTPKGWAVPNRYDITVASLISSLTVQNAAD